MTFMLKHMYKEEVVHIMHKSYSHHDDYINLCETGLSKV